MEVIDTLRYGDFCTIVKITDEVKMFFENNGIADLTKDMNSDEWYQGWLLKYLDKNKDGIPDSEFGKEFELIFTRIIQNPEDYQDLENILEDLEIDRDQVIFDGSKTVFADSDPEKTKFWIRWIVIKKIKK